MSQQPKVQALARRVRSLAGPPAPDSSSTRLPDAEPEQLAREAVKAYADALANYRRLAERERTRPDPGQPPPEWYIEGLSNCPPQDVSFFDIERLSKVDPALGRARWEEVKENARNDLAGGWLAARALEFLGGSAWERACFLATRNQLREAWQPRNAGEALLLDQMAQYERVRQQWVGVLATMARDPRLMIGGEQRDLTDKRRPQTAAEANREAMLMVERCQRLFEQALRAFLSLRRVKASVNMYPSGPVTVTAGPQLSVTTPPVADEVEISEESAIALGGTP